MIILVRAAFDLHDHDKDGHLDRREGHLLYESDFLSSGMIDRELDAVKSRLAFATLPL